MNQDAAAPACRSPISSREPPPTSADGDAHRRADRQGPGLQAQNATLLLRARIPGYGKLSGKTLTNCVPASGVEVDAKQARSARLRAVEIGEAGEPAWDSPWGKGAAPDGTSSARR